MSPPSSDVPLPDVPSDGTSGPVEDEQVETYLDDLRHDLRVERALRWRQAVALLAVAVVVIAYFFWTR